MTKKQRTFGSLEIIAFVSGFALMAYELVAARILAPTIGSSMYVWTAVIGTIIAALSAGYFLGGKLADARAKPSDIAWLCLASATAIVWTLIVYMPVLGWVAEAVQDVRLQGVVASLVLFVPASVLLGILSPYLVKLRVTSLARSGQSVASLSAFNSIGGIVGTFVTGFILFGYVGSRESLVIFASVMVMCSWLVVPRVQVLFRTVISMLVVLAVFGVVGGSTVVVIDTPSAHYQVLQHVETSSGRDASLLVTGPRGAQSGVYDDNPYELLFWYSQEIARVAAAAPSRDRIAVLGGGAFTLPQYFARAYPGSQIDAVEIDPVLETIAIEYFGYQQPGAVQIVSEDARSFVNQAEGLYDIVVVDVYSDTSVPFSLLTVEYGESLARIVAPGGVVIVNAVAGTTGGCVPLLSAIHTVYSGQFPYHQYVQNPAVPVGERGNIIIEYSRYHLAARVAAQQFSLSSGPYYTDNFAPAERLHQQCFDD